MTFFLVLLTLSVLIWAVRRVTESHPTTRATTDKTSSGTSLGDPVQDRVDRDAPERRRHINDDLTSMDYTRIKRLYQERPPTPKGLHELIHLVYNPPTAAAAIQALTGQDPEPRKLALASLKSDIAYVENNWPLYGQGMENPSPERGRPPSDAKNEEDFDSVPLPNEVAQNALKLYGLAPPRDHGNEWKVVYARTLRLLNKAIANAGRQLLSEDDISFIVNNCWTGSVGNLGVFAFSLFWIEASEAARRHIEDPEYLALAGLIIHQEIEARRPDLVESRPDSLVEKAVTLTMKGPRPL